MADARKVVEIVFGAVDETGNALSSVGQGIDSAVSKISGVTAPLSELGNAAVKAELAIAAAGAAMIALAVNEAAKLNAAVAESGTLFAGTAEEVAELRQMIVTYGRDSVQPIDQVTSAVYSAISAGTQWKDSIGLVSQAEKLAVAGKAELGATTVLLASSMNAYGASAEEAERYSDLLFTTVRNGQTTIPELASSLAQVTSIAAASGIPFETLLSAVASLTASGAPTSQAITQIKAAISNIITPSKQAAEMAELLGIEFNASALQSKGFEGVLADVYKATGGNVEQMGKLFGSVEGLAGALSLGADKSGVFAKSLTDMQNSAGATTAAYDEMGKQLGNILQNLSNNFKLTLADAGQPLVDSFAGVAGSLSDIFKAIGASIDSGAFKPVYDALNRAADGLKTFLDGVAKAIPEAFAKLDFSGLISSSDALGKAIIGIFGGLDLTKPDDLAKAMQAVLDTIESLTRVVTGIAQAWAPMLQTIGEMIAKFNQGEVSTKEFVGQILGASQIFETFKGVLTPLTGGLDLMGSSLTAIAGIMGVKLIGSSGAIPATSAAFTALAGVIGGPAIGLIAAVTALAAAYGYFLDKADTKGQIEQSKQELERLKEASEKTRAEFAEWDKGFGYFTGSVEDLKKASADTAAAIERITNAVRAELPGDRYDEQVAGLTMWERAIEKINEQMAEQGKVLLANGKVVDGVLDVYGNLVAGVDKAGNSIKAATLIVDESTGKVVGYRGSWEDLTEAQQLAVQTGSQAGTEIKKVADSAEEVAKAAKAAEEAQRAWNLEMAKIEGAKQIALIESATAVTTERIKADAATMVAAFDSVSASITSTGDVLGSLYGTLGSGDLSRLQEIALEEELRKESKRRDEAMELQRKLTEAQIANLQARTEKIRDGMAEIIIQADGVEPHIEAFMFQILSKIQVRATELGANWLVGGGLAAP